MTDKLETEFPRIISTGTFKGGRKWAKAISERNIHYFMEGDTDEEAQKAALDLANEEIIP